MNHVISESGVWRGRLIGWVSNVLAIVGLILSFVDDWWIMLAAAGFFGPGLLMEAGLIKTDEFKEDSQLRAGHRAFLMGGLFLAFIVGLKGCGQRYSASSHEIYDAIPASLILLVMMSVFYLSKLIRFWGARVAAFRVSVFYGLAFVALVAFACLLPRHEGTSPDWGGMGQAFVFGGVMVGAGFLGLRRPRLAAIMIALASTWLFRATGTHMFFGQSNLPWEVTFDVVVYTMLLPVTAVFAFLKAGFGRD